MGGDEKVGDGGRGEAVVTLRATGDDFSQLNNSLSRFFFGLLSLLSHCSSVSA